MGRAKRMALRWAVGSARKVARDPARVRDLVDRAREKGIDHRGALRRGWQELQTLLRLVGAWARGEYRDVPWRTILLAVAAILYFINPFDAVTDLVPVAGFVDDLGIIGLVVASIKNDIDAFVGWERTEEPALPQTE